ncbi:hypothetical protein TWF718_006858 [Orbilia javanica]|uniref:Uncharacterized protein n=1 Tax=Orbilia javanica TaxID=47235 RepID=A0AAN8RDE9_9PEZI
MHPSLNYHNADRASNTISCPASPPGPLTLLPTCSKRSSARPSRMIPKPWFLRVISIQSSPLLAGTIMYDLRRQMVYGLNRLRHRPFLGSDCFNLLRIHAFAGSPSHFDSSDAGDIQRTDKGACLYLEK